MHLLSLPVEIQKEILSQLPWHDHFQVAKVCRRWASIFQDAELRRRRYFPKYASNQLSTVLYNSKVSWPPHDTGNSWPSHSILLDHCLLITEFRPGRESTVLLRVPPAATVPQTETAPEWPHRDVITNHAMRKMIYDFSIDAKTTYALMDITNSPLLSSDKIIFPRAEPTEGHFTDNVDHNSKSFDMVSRFWKKTADGYAGGRYKLSTGKTGRERFGWDSAGKTMQDLVEALRARMEADVFPDPKVLGCWCTPSEYIRLNAVGLNGAISVYVDILLK
ncbi:hypothetical protein TWF281_010451 [Arthrobotrys megalospora]